MTSAGRRVYLRAELDAYYTRLCGLTRDELRYILDPKDVYGDDPSAAPSLRSGLRQGKLPKRNVPRAEGEGDAAVWGRYAVARGSWC